MRAYIHRWWTDDPDVLPCPRCKCPLQAGPGHEISEALAAHFEVVHQGVAVPQILTTGSAS